jgi:hypothetical protein
MKKQHSYSNMQSNDGLFGYWHSGIGSLQINQDGTLNYAGQIYLYTAQNNILTIISLTNAYQIPYQQNGDILRLVINGQQLTFTRKSQIDQNRMGTEGTYNQGLEDSGLKYGNSNPMRVKFINPLWHRRI